MGFIPATGTQVTMGRISRALGITGGFPPPAGSNIRLNGTLGMNRNLATTPISAIPSGSITRQSTDFGGLDTPNDY
jgi:hypothetical protein